MTSAKLLPVAFAVLYASFLVAGVPARVAGAWLRERVPSIDFRAPAGTVYDGAVRDLSAAGVALGDLRWHLAPGALLAGCGEWRVAGEGGIARVRGAVGACLDARRYLRGFSASAPASTLASALAGGALEAAGEITARVERAERTGAGALRAHGRLVWDGAALTLDRRIDLGTVIVAVHDEGDALVADVDNRGGDVRVAARVRLDARGEYDLRGRLDAKSAAAAATLARYLARDPSGGFPFDVRGRLAQWL